MVLFPMCASVVEAGPSYTLLNYGAFSTITGEPDYPATSLTIGSQPLANGVQMFGQFGPISGSEYLGGSTDIQINGAFEGDDIPPGGTHHTAGEFTFTFTGGSVTLDQVSTWVPTLQSFGTRPGSEPATSGQPISFAYDTSYDSDPFPEDTTDGSWYMGIAFTWTDFAPTDTLTLTIPQHSLDVTSNSSVPEPMVGASLLSLAAMYLGRRRPRTHSL
jgi:hypothetical protein